MIKETTLKIFLTSGITLTVSEKEKIHINGKDDLTLHELIEVIKYAISNKMMLEFMVEIDHKYDEKKKQKVKHYYNIPYDKISWFMIEEV